MMKLPLLLSIALCIPSTLAFHVNQPAFVAGRGGATAAASGLTELSAKATAAASKEEDLELTRKIILDRMGGGAKAEEAPPTAPAAEPVAAPKKQKAKKDGEE
jgi:hypothetical protein